MIFPESSFCVKHILDGTISSLLLAQKRMDMIPTGTPNLATHNWNIYCTWSLLPLTLIPICWDGKVPALWMIGCMPWSTGAWQPWVREIPDITLLVTFALQDISPAGVGGCYTQGFLFLSDVMTAAGRLQKFLLIVKSQIWEQGDI